MTKTITIMTGSVREGNISEHLLPLVQAELTKHSDITIEVANLREMELPFIDTPITPADETYTPNHESVLAWQALVQKTDAFIMLTPEYNHMPSPAQINAIDWLAKDWADKPVTILSYGWGGGLKSATLLKALLEKVGAAPTNEPHALFFTKDIDLDGSVIDNEHVITQITDAINEVV